VTAMIDGLWLIGSLSLAGSILALAMLLVRPVARHFLSKRLLYLLWLLVIFQLLIPIPAGQIAFGKLTLQPVQTMEFSQAADSNTGTAVAHENPVSIPGSGSGRIEASAALESSSGSTDQKSSINQTAGTTAREVVVHISQTNKQIRAKLYSHLTPLAFPAFSFVSFWLSRVAADVELLRYLDVMCLFETNSCG